MRPVFSNNRAGGRMAAAALALCLAAGFATGARAEGDRSKWYIGANIPVMFIDNTKTSVRGTTTVGPTTASYTANGLSHYGLGFRIGGVVGYRILPNLRIEGELFYGFARVKKTVYSGARVKTPQATIPINAKINQPTKGNARMLGAMANAWYDIDTGSAWRPFVGGGIGVFQADFSALKWDADRTARAFALPVVCSGGSRPTPGTQQCTAALQAIKGVRPKDKDTVFAYQIGGGIGYRVDDSVTIQASYRFQMAPGLQFDGKGATASVKTKSDMKIHLFEIGFRYNF